MDKVKKIVCYQCNDTLYGKYTGQGIGVAVLDTGIAPHPDFRGRVVAFKDCINGNKALYDDSGHGTHVAGILAGDGRMSKGILAGMAPGANLIIIKVLDAKGDGNIEQIIEGILWIKKYGKQYGVRIVNLSVGARTGMSEKKEQQLLEAVEDLWDMGYIVVVSAGNYGPGKGTVAGPGTSKKVITVGALKTTEKEMECSGQGPTGSCVVKPDVVAPGYGIISCNNVSNRNRKPYTVKSGTSMATPVVSGAIALLLSKYPETHNVEVKLKLKGTCKHQPLMKGDGWGCLQVEKLLQS